MNFRNQFNNKESIEQADQGELISHQEVMKKYSQWLSK